MGKSIDQKAEAAFGQRDFLQATKARSDADDMQACQRAKGNPTRDRCRGHCTKGIVISKHRINIRVSDDRPFFVEKALAF
jgi:hypothetical protein